MVPSAINNNPAIVFDGIDDVLYDADGNYMNGINTVSVFTVVEHVSVNVDGLIFDGGGSDLNSFKFAYTDSFSSKTDTLIYGTGDDYTFNANSIQQSGPAIAGFTHESTDQGTGYYQGKTFGVTGYDDGSDTIVSSFMKIGNGGASGIDPGAWDGKIAEVIMYTRVLSTADIAKVNSYLALKYGITLDQTAPGQTYVDSGGAVIWTIDAAYDNDIAGIGRDNGTGSFDLLQLKSKSENSDGVVTIEADVGNVGDLEFLVWGNDDGSIDTAETTDKPATVDQRLARKWKFQETGELGSVTVGFDLANQSAIAETGNAANYSLLVDSDGTFIDATVVTSGRTFNGDVIEFTYNLDDAPNAYFTLGYSAATFRRRVIVVESN